MISFPKFKDYVVTIGWSCLFKPLLRTTLRNNRIRRCKIMILKDGVLFSMWIRMNKIVIYANSSAVIDNANIETDQSGS